MRGEVRGEVGRMFWPCTTCLEGREGGVRGDERVGVICSSNSSSSNYQQ